MKISAGELGYLLAECFNAITPDTDSMRARRWVGKLGPCVALMLRLDPEDVEWVMEILEDEAGAKGLPMDEGEESGKIDDTPPAEQDRIWAAAEFDDAAQSGDDYAVPSDEVPDDIKFDCALNAEPTNEPGPNEYDLPDDSAPGAVSEDKASPSPDPPKPETEGFFCKMPGLDRATLKEIRRRASWVKSAAHDSGENGGRMDLVSIFPDGTPNSSYSGYEDLVKPHRKMGGCFEEAMEIERRQGDIPLLKSLPEGIVIDFPGIRPGGTKGEYGILRMARGKDGRWKAGFVWIAAADAHRRTDIFTDKVRLAVFAAKPETDRKKK